jgi:hypothetical protein
VIRKILLALAITLGLVTLGLGGLIAYIQSDSDALRSRLLTVMNEQLSVPVQASGLDLDILGQFPDISLRLDEVFIEDPLRIGSGDTLLYFQEVYAQFGLFSVLREETVLRRVTAQNGLLKLRWEEDENNFSILKADSSQTDSYLDLKGFSLLNSRIHLEGYGDTPWEVGFIAERIKLAGILDAAQMDAKVQWELLFPNWNDQAVRVQGAMEVYSNSEVDQLLVDNGQVTINDWELDLNGSIQNGLGQWTASAENLDMTDVMALLPKALIPDPSTIVADGTLDLRVVASTTPAGSRIKAEGDWKNGRLNASSGWIVGDDVRAHVIFDNGSQARLETATLDISSFAFRSRNSELSGSFRMDNLAQPRAQARLKINGRDNLMDLIHWLEYSTWSGSQGNIEGSIGWKQNFSSLEALAEEGLWGGLWSGNLTVRDALLQIEGAKQNTQIPLAKLNLLGQDIGIEEAQLQTGKTSARISGTVANVLSDNAYHYTLRITGREWFIEDITGWEIWNANFTGEPDDGEDFTDSYDLSLAVDRLRYGKFVATDASGRFSGQGLHIESDNVFLRHSGGSLAGRIEWVPLPEDRGQLLLDGRIQQVDLKSLMQSMDNFGQNQLTDKNLSGKLDATLRLSAPFDADFNLQSSALLATVDFQVSKGRITQFDPLLELSRFAEVEDLKDVRFGTVQNQLRIANEIVYIPEMTLENNALVLKVAGQHRFDNVMDFTLQMQLRDLVGGKKPARSKDLDAFIAEESARGPVWIPIHIVGPADQLKFSLDRKALSQDIKSSVQEDWKKQGQDLRNIFQKPVERPVIPEKKYQFEWEEEPDTNRSFSEIVRSFSRS